MKIIDSILTDAASIAAIRKDIHAHPELCFQEVRTADVVAKQLTDWGIPIHRGMGTTGVIGIVHGRDGGACGRGVGLRADIASGASITSGPAHRRFAATSTPSSTSQHLIHLLEHPH